MDHEIYLQLLDHEQKLNYMAEILIEKGILPKPEEDEKKDKKLKEAR